MSKENDELIYFFKALSNEERIEIIRLLHKNNELCAQEVENHFYLEQSTTSHHLNPLKRAGITKSRKQGRKVFYSIDYDQLKSTLNVFDKLIS